MKNIRASRFFVLMAVVVAPLVMLIGIVGAQSVMVQEMALVDGGLPGEINNDKEGHIWVSDSGWPGIPGVNEVIGEVRELNPDTGVYTLYEGLYGASDARKDSFGRVWWTNIHSNTFGYMVPGAGTGTVWPLEGNGSPRGVAFDDNDRVWITDEIQPVIYSVDLAKTEICVYTDPQDGASRYILADGDDIWLADWLGERILRLDVSKLSYTTWQLPSDASPFDITLDWDGNLWWADQAKDELGQLEPVDNRITRYSLPTITSNSPPSDLFERIRGEIMTMFSIKNNSAAISSSPTMIDYHFGHLWYTGWGNGTFGSLNKNIAAGTSIVISPATVNINQSCKALGVGTTITVTTTVQSIDWQDNSYSMVADSDGWKIFELPFGSPPWGIAGEDDNVWVTNQGRHQLGRLTEERIHTYLPLIISPS